MNPAILKVKPAHDYMLICVGNNPFVSDFQHCEFA
jgi:hypothetical protein